MGSHEGQKLALDSSYQVTGELALVASISRAARQSLLHLTCTPWDKGQRMLKALKE